MASSFNSLGRQIGARNNWEKVSGSYQHHAVSRGCLRSKWRRLSAGVFLGTMEHCRGTPTFGLGYPRTRTADPHARPRPTKVSNPGLRRSQFSSLDLTGCDRPLAAPCPHRVQGFGSHHRCATTGYNYNPVEMRTNAVGLFANSNVIDLRAQTVLPKFCRYGCSLYVGDLLCPFGPSSDMLYCLHRGVLPPPPLSSSQPQGLTWNAHLTGRKMVGKYLTLG